MGDAELHNASDKERKADAESKKVVADKKLLKQTEEESEQKAKETEVRYATKERHALALKKAAEKNASDAAELAENASAAMQRASQKIREAAAEKEQADVEFHDASVKEKKAAEETREVDLEWKALNKARAEADQEQRRSDAMKFAQNASEKTIKARNPSVPTLFLLSTSQGARKENIAREFEHIRLFALSIFALILLAVACCQRSAAEQPLQEPLLDSLKEVRDA